MKEDYIKHHLELAKKSLFKAESFINLAKENIATIEALLDKETKEDDFVEVLFGEELNNEIDNVVKEITSRLDKIYGSNKIVVNVKEVK